MRPPRPCPSWRRAMSRSISSRSSSRPAGRPSTTHVRPGPCDSPAVVMRRAIWPQTLLASGALLVVDEHAAPCGVGEAPDEVEAGVDAVADEPGARLDDVL